MAGSRCIWNMEQPRGTSEWIEDKLLGKVVRPVEMQERKSTAFFDDGLNVFTLGDIKVALRLSILR